MNYLSNERIYQLSLFLVILNESDNQDIEKYQHQYHLQFIKGH